MQPPKGGCSFAPGCVPELVYIFVVLGDLGIFIRGAIAEWGYTRLRDWGGWGVFFLSSRGAVAPSRAIDVSDGSIYGDDTYEKGPNRLKIYSREKVCICAPFFSELVAVYIFPLRIVISGQRPVTICQGPVTSDHFPPGLINNNLLFAAGGSQSFRFGVAPS